jgi:hypothetical protein
VPEEPPPQTSEATAPDGELLDAEGRPIRESRERRLPRWAVPAIVVFWAGFLLTFAIRHTVHRLSGLIVLLLASVFLSLAIEPGVNRLAARGWRRGRATMLILLAVLAAVLIFLGAVGTLVGTQVADLLSESEVYITDTVNFLNDNFGTNIDPQDVIDDFNDPEGRVQQFIRSQSDTAVRVSLAVVGVIFQALSVLLFTYVPGSHRNDRSACWRRGSWRSPRPVATSTREHCWHCCRRSSTGSCSRRWAPRRRRRWRCGSVSSASSCPSSAPIWPASCRCC